MQTGQPTTETTTIHNPHSRATNHDQMGFAGSPLGKINTAKKPGSLSVSEKPQSPFRDTPKTNTLDGKSSELEIIPTFRDSDVLSGRGSSINTHPGNQKLRQYAKKHKEQYNMKDTSKQLKREIVEKLKQFVLDNNGRFLTKHPNVRDAWTPLSENNILAKLFQLLREGAPKLRAQLSNQKKPPITQATEVHQIERDPVVNKSKFENTPSDNSLEKSDHTSKTGLSDKKVHELLNMPLLKDSQYFNHNDASSIDDIIIGGSFVETFF